MTIEALVSSTEHINFLVQQGIQESKVFKNLKELQKMARESNAAHFLIINRETSCPFDYHYFLSHCTEEDTSLLEYHRNSGQQLVYLQNGIISRETKLPMDQYDGYSETGIFTLSKRTVLNLTSWDELQTDKGIPCVQIKSYPLRPALFLDRDGVIIEDGHYLFRPVDAKIYPDIIPLIKKANQLDWYVFVLTNQSGVARGYFTEEDVTKLHLHLDQLLQDAGAYINRWYSSPFYPKCKNNYGRESLLRKPSPGMLLQACNNQSVNLNESFMIGDKESDIIQQPGIRTLLIQRSYPLEDINAPIFFDLKTVKDYLFK